MRRPWALPSWTATWTRPAFLPPLENTGTVILFFALAVSRPVPPTLLVLPVTKPGETSRLWLSLSTSSLMLVLPPDSLLMSRPLPMPETLVNAQPVGFCDQPDHVSAAPDGTKPPGPVTSPRRAHRPQPANSLTLTAPLPACGSLPVMVSGSGGPPLSTL